MEPEENQIDEEKEDVDFAQPIFKKNIYQNPDSFKEWLNPPTIWSFSGLRILFRWIFCEKNESKIPKDELQLQKTLPVQKPDFPITSPLGATWLGHATVFVKIEGLSLITDPVWSAYASPLSWHGCRRYRPPPCKIAELPEIHIAVISHNHYDHLDHKAVKELNARFPRMQWFVPRGLRNWMIQTIGEGEESTIHELSWGEHVELNLPNGGGSYKIWSVPAQHWSQRRLFDRFQSLWCGWLVEAPTHKFLFTGDTGFCENEFKKIGQKFGKIDLSAIPIGCYSPRWFMRPQHIDPSEAVQIHKLTNSRKSIAIHWGTYEMGSCEPYMEPASKLREEVEANGLNADEFTTLAHGESWTIDD